MQKLGAGGRQDGRGRASQLGREGGSHGSRATSGMQGGTLTPFHYVAGISEPAMYIDRLIQFQFYECLGTVLSAGLISSTTKRRPCKRSSSPSKPQFIP